MIRVWLADEHGARAATLEEAHRVVRDGSANAWLDFEGEDEIVARVG